METIGIFTSKAVSLRNVGRDIAFVAQSKGMVPRLFSYIIPPYEVPELCRKAIYIMTYSPVWCTHWVLNAYDVYRHGKGIPVLFYGTVEGKIKRHLIRKWMMDAVPYVANSKYTYEKLVEAGLRVIDIVYHGVNFQEIAEARKLKQSARNYIARRTGEGIIYGAVLSGHPRKAHEQLLEAFRKARGEAKDIKLYIISKKPITPTEGVFLDTKFGEYSRTELLAIIGAFDYLIIPSYCEGFGLPLVEANALGVPVIHCMYPPLSEITCDANITFPYKDIQYVDLQEGILYEYHIYDTKDLASAILEARNIVKEEKEKYLKIKNKAVEHAKKFNIMKHYSKLLKLFDKV